MIRKTLIFFSISVFLATHGFEKYNKSVTHKYPLLYRDYVFHNLSDNGRDIYYAIKIHPTCLEKQGDCVPRAKCVGKKILYFTRVCYRRDLVCCYDDTPRQIWVEPKVYGITTEMAAQTEGITDTATQTVNKNSRKRVSYLGLVTLSYNSGFSEP
ncbi:hypothetical protein K1T71_003178 [Dendrolimus kikuchii]|uniref:Uncharacterized protein n=1 Tax=Dendrolimus kikuchii TaxID=765133 RepID=A0ACC1DBW2_9NEOP|nr:hypothetical protein K1T71_003178 [Dendrolimus kikuchii]